MSTQQGLSFSVFPRPFGVKVQWFWPEGSREGDVVAVQALRGKALTELQIVRFPKDRAFINGLRLGEAVQIRARMMSDASDYPAWQVRDWRNATSLTNISDWRNASTLSSVEVQEDPHVIYGATVQDLSFESPHIREARIAAGSIRMTAGDDIERQALREVLVEVLPRTESKNAIAVAADIATAVSAAFKRLDNLRDTDAGKS